MLTSKLAVVITRVCHRHWIVVTAPNINDRNRRRCHNRPLSVICECVRSLSLFASVCVSPTEPIAQGSTNAMQIQCTKTRRLFKLDCVCGCTHSVLLQPRQTKDCTKTIQKHKLKTVQTKVVGTYLLAMLFPSWHKSYTVQAKKKRIRNSTHI